MKRLSFPAYVACAIPVGILFHVLLVLAISTVPTPSEAAARDVLFGILRYGPSVILLAVGLLFTEGVRGWSFTAAVRIGIVIGVSTFPLLLTTYPIVIVWCLVFGDCP